MSRGYYQINDLKKHLKNPSKCLSEKVSARSGWEISMCVDFLDKHSSVLEWSSEEIIILYQCPVRGMSTHRYFPDVWMKVKESNGNIKEYIVEIKPEIEFQQIKQPKRKNRAYIDRVNTWIVNQTKWEAARNYCKRLREQGKNIEFVVMTELGIHYEDGRLDKVCFFKT